MPDINDLSQALEKKDWETAEKILQKHTQDDTFKAQALQVLLALEAQKKININEMIKAGGSFEGGTAPLLHRFIFKEYLELSKLFHATGKLDLTQPNGYGRTALHVAASYGDTQFVEWMLPLLKPADLIRQDQDGATPLYVALAEADSFPIAKIFIKTLKAANLSIDEPVTKEGRTPLMRVARSGDICIRMGKRDPAPYIDMVHTLVEEGANVLCLNKDKCTAYNYAMLEDRQLGTCRKDKTAITIYLKNAERAARKREAEAMSERVAQLTKEANLDKASPNGRRPSVEDTQRAERARGELAELAAEKQRREELERIEDTALEGFYYTFADSLTKSLDAYVVLSTGLVSRAKDKVDTIAGFVGHFGELVSFLPGATFLFKVVGKVIQKTHEHSVEEVVGRIVKLTNASTRGADINEAARRFTIDCVAKIESAVGGKFAEGAVEQLVKLTIVRLLRYVDATFSAKQAVAKSGWKPLYGHMMRAIAYEPKQLLGKVNIIIGGKTVEYSDAALFQMVTPDMQATSSATASTTRPVSPSCPASPPPSYSSLFPTVPSAPAYSELAESKEKGEAIARVEERLKSYEAAKQKGGFLSHKITKEQVGFLADVRETMQKSTFDDYATVQTILEMLKEKAKETVCTSDKLLHSAIEAAISDVQSLVPATKSASATGYDAYKAARAEAKRRHTPPDGKEGKAAYASTAMATAPVG